MNPYDRGVMYNFRQFFASYPTVRTAALCMLCAYTYTYTPVLPAHVYAQHLCMRTCPHQRPVNKNFFTHAALVLMRTCAFHMSNAKAFRCDSQRRLMPLDVSCSDTCYHSRRLRACKCFSIIHTYFCTHAWHGSAHVEAAGRITRTPKCMR